MQPYASDPITRVNHFEMVLQAEDKRWILVYDRISVGHPSERDLSTDADDNNQNNGDDSKISASALSPQPSVVSSPPAVESDARCVS